MSNLIIPRPCEFSLELFFPTYSFHFLSHQSTLQPKPISSLYFQRFSSLHEYPPLPTLVHRFCAQVEIPNIEHQSDYQQLFFSTLNPNNTLYTSIVAEAIDENAEFVYLIIDQNYNQGVSRFFEGFTLEIFKFYYSEIWNVSLNLETYLKNLQLTNLVIIRRFIDTCGCYEFFKASVDNWQTQVVNSDLKLSKKIEEMQKKNKVKKIDYGKCLSGIELPDIDCLLCASNPKSIAFLPCGHVVACKVCTTENMQIEIGKVINQRRTPRNCPICVQPIKEAKEVVI